MNSNENQAVLTPPLHTMSAPVVFLDVDLIPAEDIATIIEKMTPIFVRFSGTRAARLGVSYDKAVIIGPSKTDPTNDAEMPMENPDPAIEKEEIPPDSEKIC